MIVIKNLRDVGSYKAVLSKEYQVRVDRTSVLGNPFPMKWEAERNDVCLKYAKYFKQKLRTKDVEFCKELKRLISLYKKYGKLELYCWCAPKKCHAETIKDFIEWYINKEN